MEHFPVAQSILSPEALLRVAAEFAIERPARCDFLRRGLNDTYLVRGTTQQSILRVYRANRYSVPEIRYEIDLLCYLVWKGLSVPRPILLKQGGYLREVQAPEGPRQVAMFTVLPGNPPAAQDAGFVERYAAAVGALHAASNGFVSPHPRPALDLDYLIDRPLVALRAYLHDRWEDRAYVQRLAHRLRTRIEGYAPHLDWGVCHGDASLTNIHVTQDGHISFFDFDNAGPGWRANDTAAFWGNAKEHGDETLWQAFLRGYTSQHPLSNADVQVLPTFHAARMFMSLGFHAGNAIYWGVHRQREIVDAELDSLCHWEVAYLSG